MTEKKMTITTDDAGRPIIDGVPAIAAADFELLIADVLAEEDDETDAPIADEEEDGAMYREAFAGAEERVAARRVGSGGSVDDNPIHGIAIDRIIDFAVGKLDESRITEAREDLWLLRERSAAYALRNPRA